MAKTEKIKAGAPKLTPGTLKMIKEIKNETIRELLLKGLHPSEVVEGWYFILASEIIKDQGNED